MGIKKENKETVNPLFVVTNQGKDVEEAEGLMDAMIKKYGLRPIMDLFSNLIGMIMEQIKGNVAFIIVKGLIDDLVDALEMLLKMIDPVFAFNFIKR